MKRLLVLFVCLASHIAFADTQSISCITNKKDLTVGQTVDEVINLCGEPTEKVTHEVTTSYDKKVTEWYYLFQLDNELQSKSKPVYILTKLELDFYQQQVDHINFYVSNKNSSVVNALSLLGYVIEEGETEDQVKQVFGSPIKTSEKTVANDQTETITDALLYTDEGATQQLNFTDGQLVDSSIPTNANANQGDVSS